MIACMTSAIRLATANDVQRLLPLVRALWLFERIPFDAVAVGAALQGLHADPSLGCVWVAETANELAGYTVVTFGYSLEHGGLVGLVDELYVTPALRDSGIGTQLIDRAVHACRERGVRRLQLEVDDVNPRAASLYARLGFETNARALLTKAL
jgi:ribosomal protein S18 acetylase RimI-like enzyme